MTIAEHTLLRIEDFLKKEGLDRSNATVVLVADYASPEDLRKFKPGWNLGEYRTLIQELHRLAADKPWRLNSSVLIDDEKYEEFSTQNGYVSRLAYVLAVLGYEGQPVTEEGAVRGVSPVVIRSSGSTRAAVLFTD